MNEIDERGYLQAWGQGREDEFDFFTVRTENMLVFGVEVSGVIYYVVPKTTGDEILVFITLESEWKKLLEPMLDVSVPQFEVLSQHCPTFCRAVLDGFTNDSRFDRGAFARIDNAYVLAREMPYDFNGALDSENPIEAIASSNIANVVGRLIELYKEIIDEWDKFDGFSTYEKVKISAKEIWNGAKIGWKYSRILSFLYN